MPVPSLPLCIIINLQYSYGLIPSGQTDTIDYSLPNQDQTLSSSYVASSDGQFTIPIYSDIFALCTSIRFASALKISAIVLSALSI